MFTGNYACDGFKTGLASGTFNFATGTTQVFKIALYTNTATLNAQTTGYTATGEVSASGYTAGGATLTISQVPTTDATTGIMYLSFSDVTWSSALTARGALIYKVDAGSGNPAICVLDFGADKTSVSGTFNVVFPPVTTTSAIIRLQTGTA